MKMSRLEAAIRVSLEFYEAFNRHDAAGMMKLISEDCLFEGSGPAPEGAAYSGKEAVTEFWQEFFRASPQAQIEIEEIFGLGMRCVARWKYSWVDAEGERGYVRGVDILRVKNGAIYERLSYIKG